MSENTPAERWLPVAGFEGRYMVSDHGRVWSELRQRMLSPSTTEGYPSVVLYASDRGRHGRLVHRLVLEAFVCVRPPMAEACHWDGDRSNARLENLRWGSRGENLADARRHGTRPLVRWHGGRRGAKGAWREYL